MTGYVYAIRNTTTGRVYVGATRNVGTRWRQHISDLKAGRHCSAELQRDWVAYGAEKFTFQVLQIVDGPVHVLSAKEHEAIETHLLSESGAYNRPSKTGRYPRIAAARKAS